MLAALAPGTVLRGGVERIQRRRAGALIVLGHDETVAAICSGGFELDAELSATALAELAKMDGAIILNDNRIVRAAVHLAPDPEFPTGESGTRHRTAERVARHTGYPVISVSQSTRSVRLYLDDRNYLVEDALTLLSRANQALAFLERCARRIDELTAALSALDSAATGLDVAAVAQRLEMARRASEEIEEYAAALGPDGRLLLLQRDELASDLEAELHVLLRDHCTTRQRHTLAQLARLSSGELSELSLVAKALGFETPDIPEQRAAPADQELLRD